MEIKTLDLLLLTAAELETFHSYKSEKRQLEFYNCRVLWASFKIDSEITYKPTGKPKIKNGFISISHSQNKIALAYSKHKETGIDLELISEKVQTVKSKYLHNSETFSTKLDLTKIWTIKEAIYKLYDSDKISFKRDIKISKIEDSANATVTFNNERLVPTITVLELNKEFILSFAQ